MLKGLALTPPVIGRITIGKIVERGGKRLPEKDDEFTLTSQVQSRDGWINHPLDEVLRKSTGSKLRAIPVRLLFNDPELNFRANYSLFDRYSGRPLCVGNGEMCRRVTETGMQTLNCPAPQSCALAEGGACKPYGRLNVRIGDDDELGTFIFRTTGFNSIRTLITRLSYFHAVSEGLLAYMPLELRLRGKSTTQSHRSPIYYVDLVVRSGMSLAETISQARAECEMRKDVGFNQEALDKAARAGFMSGAFEDSDEDGEAIVEEFYSGEMISEDAVHSPRSGKVGRANLAEKLVAQLPVNA